MTHTSRVTQSLPPSQAEYAAQLLDYQQAGVKRAAEIGNRGPIRWAADGQLHADILAAYWQHGYYIFENVIDADEIAALRLDAADMIARAPVTPDAKVDAKGRPARGLDFGKPAYRLAKPLADPWGGTQLLNGRHPTKMLQPTPDKDAPEYVVFLMYGMCQSMPAGLRLYGHPHLLKIAEAINGPDFTPYNDAIFVKQPGLGGSVSWHQDGVTHWEAPNWDEGIHGFNFQVQLYQTTPANGLWVLPGSHKQGRIDIKTMVAENPDGERLPGSIPLVCGPGDVTIVNRQMLHGSFANYSQDMRVSITFGFHRRTSVLGAKAGLSMTGNVAVYDEAHIFDRSAVVQVAIDARQKHMPSEQAYRYQPFAGLEDQYRFTAATEASVIKDYFMKDLAI
jgi:ectoine hydroxylase-related dioxygenase (phytanoyl-CoA dioxygenase family)